jgi:hypothetical protein
MMPAEKLIIVTEGKSDVPIIRILLGGELTSGMRFFAGQGRESLVTLGRNLLVHEGGPVLLVMDVSTAEMRFKDEMLAQTMRALSAVGVPGTFEVFAFTPEIEIVFFEAPETLQRAMGTALPAQTLEEGRRSPKATLERILKEANIPNTDSLIRKLDEQAIQSLSSGKQATALRGKVRAFCRLESLAGI